MDFKSERLFFIKKKRFYDIDLTERNYLLEFSSPHEFKIQSAKFNNHSWGNLIESVTDYLVMRFYPTINELLDFRTTWTDRPFFSMKKLMLAYKGPLANRLYIDTNHTSVHLCFLLQDLLAYFNVDVKECNLLVRIKPRGEKKEVQEYFYHKNIRLLKVFLESILFYSEGRITSFIKAVKKIDLMFREYCSAWYSLLLFDDHIEFNRLTSDFLRKYKKNNKDKIQIVIINTILDELKKFYSVYY